jgi:hypothetical protein
MSDEGTTKKSSFEKKKDMIWEQTCLSVLKSDF